MSDMDENFCEETKDNKHEPDWDTVVVTHDIDHVYVDLHCKHCQQHGNIAMISKHAEVNW